MTKKLFILCIFLSVYGQMPAQTEPEAGNWKTWFIASGKDYRLPAPPAYKEEIAEVLALQQKLDSAALQQIVYWSAGTPGYSWEKLMDKIWMNDALNKGLLANMLLSEAIYDVMAANL